MEQNHGDVFRKFEKKLGRKKKNNQAATGFEPMISTIPPKLYANK